MNRYDLPFQPVNSSAPSFNSTLGSSGVYALQATSTGRVWQGPGSRSVRLVGTGTTPVYVQLGSASTTTSAVAGTSMLIKGDAEVLRVAGGISHIAFKSSTDVTVNVTLGYGK